MTQTEFCSPSGGAHVELVVHRCPCKGKTNNESSVFFGEINKLVEKYFPSPKPCYDRPSGGVGQRLMSFIGLSSFESGKVDSKTDLPVSFFRESAWTKRKEADRVLQDIHCFQATRSDLNKEERTITRRAEHLFTQMKKRETVQLALLVSIAVSAVFLIVGSLTAAGGAIALGSTGILIAGTALLVRKGKQWYDDPIKRRADKLKDQLACYQA